MSLTRVPWAIWTPATFDPAYPGGKHYSPRALSDILYVVNHDARGYRGYLRQGQRPGEQASWTFSNLTNGELHQHRELELPTWTSGGKAQNVFGLSTEHENEAGPWGIPQPFPFTPEQVTTDRRLYEWLRDNGCVNLRPPVYLQGFREHKELTGGATSCPNNRTSTLYASYEHDQEEDMGQQDIDDIKADLKAVKDALGIGFEYDGDPRDADEEKRANLPSWIKRHFRHRDRKAAEA